MIDTLITALCTKKDSPVDAAPETRGTKRAGRWTGMLKPVCACVLCLVIGLVSGGMLFAHSQPRSLLALQHCQQCLKAKDLAGLLASVGIQQFAGLLPAVVAETDRTIALQVPSTEWQVHYVIMPKKDIKNIGELAAEDVPYLIDSFAVAQQLIADHGLFNYRIFTNGPGWQDVTYLHFHLVSK
jgi:hypothetical protein